MSCSLCTVWVVIILLNSASFSAPSIFITRLHCCNNDFISCKREVVSLAEVTTSVSVVNTSTFEIEDGNDVDGD